VALVAADLVAATLLGFETIGEWIAVLALALIYARRLHDLGRSGWWGLAIIGLSDLPLGLMLFPGFGDLAAMLGRGDVSQAVRAAPLFRTLAIATALVQLGLTVIIGAWKGQATWNGFGPPPGKKGARLGKPGVLLLDGREPPPSAGLP
jgi:uncharacterized membrane protein YhaH (DUF805 family)